MLSVCFFFAVNLHFCTVKILAVSISPFCPRLSLHAPVVRFVLATPHYTFLWLGAKKKSLTSFKVCNWECCAADIRILLHSLWFMSPFCYTASIMHRSPRAFFRWENKRPFFFGPGGKVRRRCGFRSMHHLQLIVRLDFRSCLRLKPREFPGFDIARYFEVTPNVSTPNIPPRL